MDYETHKALSHVIEHENLSVIKQLRKELAKEKHAHKLTRHEYESLIELIPTMKKYNSDCVPFLCPACNQWFDLDADVLLEHFFVFKRDLNGDIKLEMTEVCYDCYYDRPHTCKNESIWLSEGKFPGLDEYADFVDAYYTASYRNGVDMKTVAALIIQRAFRHNWDWNKH